MAVVALPRAVWRFAGPSAKLRLVARPEPHMIGRTFVAEGQRHRSVHREMRLVRKGEGDKPDGMAIADDGTIYVPVESGVLYAFDPDGAVKWTFDLMGYSGPSASPAIGGDGTIYVGATQFCAINPDGTLKQSKFLRLALGAAYTPLALGDDGKIYTENFGDLFVVGN